MTIGLTDYEARTHAEQCRGERCAFHATHDPETEEPTGRRCGKVATQVIVWRDGRLSTSCGQHGAKALDDSASALVLRIEPIEPAVDVTAVEVT